MRQFARKIEDLRFGSSTAARQKRIVRITLPATGKIVPVIRIVSAQHADLVAIVQQRHAPYREKSCERKTK